MKPTSFFFSTEHAVARFLASRALETSKPKISLIKSILRALRASA